MKVTRCTTCGGTRTQHSLDDDGCWCPQCMKHGSRCRSYSESLDGDRKGRVRKPDHATSAEGAKDVARRAGTQSHRLLVQFGRAEDGLTDEEAGTGADLEASCYWKRCGELRQDGLIAETMLTRPGIAGVQRIVSTITERGKEALSQARTIDRQLS